MAAEGRRRRWADAAALGLGLSLPLAFAPFDLWPLAPLIAALMFQLWQCPPGRAAWRGFLFGAGAFGIGASWVFVAIHVYGETSALVAALLVALFVAVLGLWLSLQGYASAHLARWLNARAPAARRVLLALGLAALWTLFEWVRGWLLTGFPWLNLGYSQIDSPLAGYAPLLGVYGVSWAVALSAALLWLAVGAGRRQRVVAAVALLAVWLAGFGLGQANWTRPVGEPLRVALVQGNAPQLTKWDAEQVRLRLGIYARLTREHFGTPLVMWPENAMTLFYHQLADEYLEPLAADALEHGTELLVGLPFMDHETERYYSSLMSLGRTRGVYHKRHLVPFGEYVPLESLLRGLIGFFDLPMSGFSHGGQQQRPLVVAGQPVAPSVCYEDAYGEELIHFLPEATLLVNGSNNAWYGNSLAPHQHLQIARMRASETGRELLRTTTNGISAIVDHRGALVATSPQFEEFVLQGTVQPRSGATPYVRTGNWPVVWAAALLVLAVVLAGRRAAPATRRAG